MLRIGSILFLIAVPVLGDQLQLNPDAMTAKAVDAIRPYSIMISYCSEADVSNVEVWRVLSRMQHRENNGDHSRTLVIAERLYVSERAYGKGKYKPPVTFHRILLSAPSHQRVVVESVDLAYVYSSDGDNRFRCIAKKLGFDCGVDVEEIVLPDEVFQSISEYLGPEQEYKGNRHIPKYNVAGTRM
jgi:hypothetical protein